ncbi:MAG: alpha/beta fold hydrolase [Alphaproteobacteria bacterium]|nr:alpha/beta fold hydrolase [Alphaproteobacteria bacterium]
MRGSSGHFNAPLRLRETRGALRQPRATAPTLTVRYPTARQMVATHERAGGGNMRHLLFGFAAGCLALAGIGYFALAALRRPDLPRAVLERKYATPRSLFVTGPDGLEIHCRDEGPRNAPAIILIHGYCASLHTWEPWMRRLSRRRRVIAVDLPGHGLTRTPPDYELTRGSFTGVVDAVARALGLHSFAIAGSSLGGAVAWDYAARRPRKIDALILVGAAGFTPGPDADVLDPASMQMLRSPLGPLLCDLDNTPWLRHGLRASFADPGQADDDMVRRYVDLSRAPMNRSVQMQVALKRNARINATAPLLARIVAPTLVLHGGQDAIVPVEDGARFADAIGGADLIVYDEAGHIVQEEAADASARDVEAFLTRAAHSRTPLRLAA